MLLTEDYTNEELVTSIGAIFNRDIQEFAEWVDTLGEQQIFPTNEPRGCMVHEYLYQKLGVRLLIYFDSIQTGKDLCIHTPSWCTLFQRELDEYAFRYRDRSWVYAWEGKKVLQRLLEDLEDV